ncbi:MAG: hypothetical protein ABIZ36_08430 [Gemmatimonadaceae bacterium]
MEPGPFRRIAVILCTAWVTLLLAEVPGFHACAVHSPSASAAGVHHDHGHDTGTNSTHKGCSCLGHACCALALSPTAQPAIVWFDVQAKAHKAIVQAASEPLPGTPEFTIPFANGPPPAPAALLNSAA